MSQRAKSDVPFLPGRLESRPSHRPVISDYSSIPAYLTDTLRWKRQTDPDFSIRALTQSIPGISHSLVSQVASGKRKLTRDRVPSFAGLLALSRAETQYLYQWVSAERQPPSPPSAMNTDARRAKRSAPANHLLADWVNVYVKDAFGIRGTDRTPESLFRALGGTIPLSRIEKSLRFLLREGFLRRTLDGRIIKNDAVTTTTDNISSSRIRTFHKKALELTRSAIDLYPPERRRSNTLVMALNQDSAQELTALLEEFYEKLISFMEAHPDDDEKLYQVVIHLTPIGGKHEA